MGGSGGGGVGRDVSSRAQADERRETCILCSRM